MKFYTGDTVSFLNEIGGGKVVKMLGKYMAIVLCEDGFELPYPTAELILLERKEIIEPTEEIKAEPINEEKKLNLFFEKDLPKPIPPPKKITEKEVDLHIEELIDDMRGLTSGEKLEMQLNYFQKELNSAIVNKFKRIVFIHGVGTGKLKQEIYSILKNYQGISYYDASYKKYGFGATEVIIY